MGSAKEAWLVSYKYRKSEYDWEGLNLPRHTDKGSESADVWATIMFPTKQGQHMGDGDFHRRMDIRRDVRKDD